MIPRLTGVSIMSKDAGRPAVYDTRPPLINVPDCSYDQGISFEFPTSGTKYDTHSSWDKYDTWR